MNTKRIALPIIIGVIVSALAFSLLLSYGLQLGVSQKSISQVTTTIQATNSNRTFTGNINSSFICTTNLSWESSPSFESIISNIENYSQFVSLEQNRTGYYFSGGDCYNSGNGTQLAVNFEYMDTAHPFQVCMNITQYPAYYINTRIFLTQTGYDLSKSKYSTVYYNATNSTYTCTGSSLNST